VSASRAYLGSRPKTDPWLLRLGPFVNQDAQRAKTDNNHHYHIPCSETIMNSEHPLDKI